MNHCENCHSETKNNKFCSRSCSASFNNKGRILSTETKFKISTSVKSNPSGCIVTGQRGTKQKEHNFKVCQECNNLFDAGTKTQSLKRKYCSLSCSNLNKYRPNSTIVHRSMYKDYQMDSGAELVFCQTLDKFNVSWVKNTSVFFVYQHNNKSGKYYPDFYLPEYDIWVEIKGKRYIREGDENRRAAVDRPTYLIISNNFKIELPIFLKDILGITN